ncbi:Tuberculostearic acid methyltransferase UfaA1 [Zhongshania aliphaticivorans]|uniref:Tuberculostearic acid methyltransferase UfaA1 n=1 Tax=Zhongshania aliphaticivorans TaxID=1470434 RepID=A0A5S9PHE0_9GAMM|nr:cyclopropane-fatty-acyl-phospholipid synthase family protein [Zhongshania aliphaticivorans]CAA0103401.1 Tuberculostearic acid methyltransferase UfaA1 [Zhongshania aliphaticivorans]CAA0113532.1 Tuberculostearic acid methyltransferase UfaA1 [Zhongshania aliphaticivorans]
MKTATAALVNNVDTGWWARRQQQMVTKALAPLSHAAQGVLRLTLPNGNSIELGEHPCEHFNPVIVLHNWKPVRKAITGGSVGWSEAYIDGDWDSPDLAMLVEWIAINETHFEGMLDSGKLEGLFQKWRHQRNANSKRGSRRNISYHYDLGNEFYQQWLDPSMTYSAAYYSSDQQTLAQAQYAKYQRIIDLLNIQDGDRILEVGCGWGGFAEQVCSQKNVSLHGITLSERQLEFAQQRLANTQTLGTAEFSLTDYRDTTGEYDHIVSIEMLEAVGEKYWPTYFSTVFDRLKPGGKASIQIITIEDQRFEQYRSNPDFIQTYIFPGGMLPTPDIFREQAKLAGLKVDDEEAFGLGYARTLREWNDVFHHRWEEIAPLGFDKRFQRMWHYYLSYCEGGFRANSIDVYQFVLEKPLPNQ